MRIALFRAAPIFTLESGFKKYLLGLQYTRFAFKKSSLKGKYSLLQLRASLDTLPLFCCVYEMCDDEIKEQKEDKILMSHHLRQLSPTS